jgi:hypothetical protein
MTLEEITEVLEEFKYVAHRIDVLVEGKKYKVNHAYLEDYSDGTYVIVLEGVDK